MRWMQDFSFGAQITHTYTHSEVEGFESRGANASLNDAQTHMFRCKCTRTLAYNKTDVCVQVCAPTHTNLSRAVSSQTANILLGCAPISRINEEVSHFTVKQRVGLRGTNGWSLQFLKSVFNNVIDFYVMR